MKKWRIGSLITGVWQNSAVFEICYPLTLSNGTKMVHLRCIKTETDLPMSELKFSRLSHLDGEIESGKIVVLSY